MRANGRPGKRPKGRVSLRARYRGREEVPVVCLMYAEADGRWYGSGRVVFDILTSPIVLSLPWDPPAGIYSYLTGVRDLRDAGMALRKIDHSVQQSRGYGPQVPDAALYPLIVEYLSAETYPDGEKRQPSSLVVLSDGTSWRVCLSDRDNGRVLWKTGDTVVAALEAVELALMEDDPAAWRRAADASGKRRK